MSVDGRRMKFAPTPDEIADRYAAARPRIVAMLKDLSPSELATPVPGTPKWTVHNLLSHLVGGPVDFSEGRIEGAGGEEWTQRQVEARREATLQQLLAEWDGVAPMVDAAARGGVVPAPVTFDILTHESDLRGALGIGPTPDPLAIRFITDGFTARATAVAAKAQLPPLEFCATDSEWKAGTPGGVRAAAPQHEWTRALTGRRSNRQVGSYEWTGDPAPYLDLLSPFGPLRDSDVIE
jgi:uncharacterized protein (TIGR03083 family)